MKSGATEDQRAQAGRRVSWKWLSVGMGNASFAVIVYVLGSLNYPRAMYQRLQALNTMTTSVQPTFFSQIMGNWNGHWQLQCRGHCPFLPTHHPALEMSRKAEAGACSYRIRVWGFCLDGLSLNGFPVNFIHSEKQYKQTDR